MKYEDFLTSAFLFPFRKKKFTCSLCALFLILILAPFTARADDDAEKKQINTSKQLIKQAKKLARKGELVEAEKMLREVIERDPKDSNARVTLGYVLLKQRRLIEAYNYSFEVARDEPKNSYAFAVLGMTLLSAGNFVDAKASFINAIKLNNTEALAWSGLGMADFYENRILLGLGKLQEAAFLEPQEPDFLFTLAQVSARAERYKEAAEAYRRFLQVSPQTDIERRDRIEGLIKFLNFLGNRQAPYGLAGASQTKVPIKLINDRPVIQIRLRQTDEPLNFVLDTGSGISVLSEETAAKMKIKAVARGGLARGIGGSGKFEIVYGFLPAIYIGEVKIKGVPVYIRKFHTNDDRIDGYIGLSLISKFLTTIDYGDSTFALINKNSSKQENTADEPSSLPLRLTSSGFLSGEVEIEGIKVPLNFIVDTGATVSVISEKLADSKEISPFITGGKLRVVGAAGVTEDVSSFLLPRISFGSHSRKSVMAIALDLDLINEASGFEQAGILGGNFLKNYRLTFDFQNSKVVFVPIK